MIPDAEIVAKHVIELLGGREKALELLQSQFRIFSERWNQDTETIGRILRSHLFVEHFLTEYLVARNPELGSVTEARLTFTQKVALVGDSTTGVSYLIPGIRLLNTIRNRLAHKLAADISMDDANILLGTGLFKALREKGAEPETPSSKPIDVLEDFAQHAGMVLQHSATGNTDLFAEAMRLAEAEEGETTEGPAT